VKCNENKLIMIFLILLVVLISSSSVHSVELPTIQPTPTNSGNEFCRNDMDCPSGTYCSGAGEDYFLNDKCCPYNSEYDYLKDVCVVLCVDRDMDGAGKFCEEGENCISDLQHGKVLDVGRCLTIEDCNDSNQQNSPYGTEVCDDKDNDCDGEIDEGIVCNFNDSHNNNGSQENWNNSDTASNDISGKTCKMLLEASACEFCGFLTGVCYSDTCYNLGYCDYIGLGDLGGFCIKKECNLTDEDFRYCLTDEDCLELGDFICDYGICTPHIPELLRPEFNKDVSTFTPTLEWTPVPEADFYKIDIVEYDYGDYNLVSTVILNTTSYKIPDGLLNLFERYYWRISAFSKKSNSFSPTAGFYNTNGEMYFKVNPPCTVIGEKNCVDDRKYRECKKQPDGKFYWTYNNCPASKDCFYGSCVLKKPHIIYPSDREKIKQKNPLFQWSMVPGEGVEYNLRLKDSESNNWLLDTHTNYTFYRLSENILDKNKTYHWFISSYDKENDWYGYTDSATFYTGSCFDMCEIGDRRCSGRSVQVCSWSNEGCYDWFHVAFCDNCASGYCQSCERDSDCGAEIPYTEPYCDGNILYQKFTIDFCSNGGCERKIETRKIEECELKCENGACKEYDFYLLDKAAFQKLIESCITDTDEECERFFNGLNLTTSEERRNFLGMSDKGVGYFGDSVEFIALSAELLNKYKIINLGNDLSKTAESMVTSANTFYLSSALNYENVGETTVMIEEELDDIAKFFKSVRDFNKKWETHFALIGGITHAVYRLSEGADPVRAMVYGIGKTAHTIILPQTVIVTLPFEGISIVLETIGLDAGIPFKRLILEKLFNTDYYIDCYFDHHDPISDLLGPLSYLPGLNTLRITLGAGECIVGMGADLWDVAVNTADNAAITFDGLLKPWASLKINNNIGMKVDNNIGIVLPGQSVDVEVSVVNLNTAGCTWGLGAGDVLIKSIIERRFLIEGKDQNVFRDKRIAHLDVSCPFNYGNDIIHFNFIAPEEPGKYMFRVDVARKSENGETQYSIGDYGFSEYNIFDQMDFYVASLELSYSDLDRDSVTLKWDHEIAFPIAYYEVYKSTSEEFLPNEYTFVAKVNQKDYTVTNLYPDTRYYFVVRAVYYENGEKKFFDSHLISLRTPSCNECSNNSLVCYGDGFRECILKDGCFILDEKIHDCPSETHCKYGLCVPENPLLITPSDGEEINTPLFKWSHARGADVYLLIIQDENDAIVLKDYVQGTSYIADENIFLKNKRYNWHVYGYNNNTQTYGLSANVTTFYYK